MFSKLFAILAIALPLVLASSADAEPETLDLYRRAALTHNNHIRRRFNHAQRLGARNAEPIAEVDSEAAEIYAAALAGRSTTPSKRSNNKNSKRCAAKATSSSTSSAAKATKSSSASKGNSNASSGGGNTDVVTGLISILKTSACGSDSGAVKKTQNKAGPNGSIDWINCGIDDGSGWNPPDATIDDLVHIDFDQAMALDIFKACRPYSDKFKTAATNTGLPALLLASFANQESSCDVNMGDGGLMQITDDKCGNAPGGNCNDPEYNINTGAQFFKDTLDSLGGNVFYALGYYNGWNKGMTKKQATSYKPGHCNEQRNLDYVHQIVNGWMQGVSAYVDSPNLRVYNNVQC